MATTFTKIESITVGSGGITTIEFSSIPSTYTDLCVKASLRTSRATITDNLTVRFNLSTTGYSVVRLRGDGVSASSTTASAQTGISLVASINGSTGTANTFSNQEIYIPNYASANNKSVSIDSVGENNSTTAYQFLLDGLWEDSTAINNIRLSSVNDFVQYSTATLYGIKNS
jgi:hypothetical protein